MQYCNTGDCTDCKLPVWRTEYFTFTSGTICGCERQKFRKTVREELTASGIEPTEEMVNKIAEMRVKEEINAESDDPVSGDHAYDNQWTGSICDSIYVS